MKAKTSTRVTRSLGCAAAIIGGMFNCLAFGFGDLLAKHRADALDLRSIWSFDLVGRFRLFSRPPFSSSI